MLNLPFSLACFSCFRKTFYFIPESFIKFFRQSIIRPPPKEEKNIYMFAVTRPSLLKSTDPKPIFRENLQKIIEDLHLFTENSEICIFCAIYCARDGLTS